MRELVVNTCMVVWRPSMHTKFAKQGTVHSKAFVPLLSSQQQQDNQETTRHQPSHLSQEGKIEVKRPLTPRLFQPCLSFSISFLSLVPYQVDLFVYTRVLVEFNRTQKGAKKYGRVGRGRREQNDSFLA